LATALFTKTYKAKADQMSLHRPMSKHKVGYPQKGILLAFER
jgi:hypothetical protein